MDMDRHRHLQQQQHQQYDPISSSRSSNRHHDDAVDGGDGGGMIELTDAATTTATKSFNNRQQQKHRLEVEPLVSSSSPDNNNNNSNINSSSSHSSSSSSHSIIAATTTTESLDSHTKGTATSSISSSSSNRQVVINIIISFVGAGLLGIPYAFAQAGWVLGAMALCTVSALNVYAMLLLPVVRQRLLTVGTLQRQQQRKGRKKGRSTCCSSKNIGHQQHSVLPQDDEEEEDDDDDSYDYGNEIELQADGIFKMDNNTITTTTTSTTPTKSSSTAAAATTTTTTPHVVVDGYGDVARLVMGSTGESMVNGSLAISQTGFATAYIIFIAANLQKLAHIPRGWTCLLCIPGLSLLVQAADMKTLARSSLFANLANLLGLSSVLFVDVETLERPHPDDIDANTVYAVQWSGLLFVMAVTLYSMEGVGLVLSLEQSCREPLYFSKLLSRTVGGITLFMAVFGCAGYWAFATHTQAPITLNLGTESTAATIVQSALCFALYLTYPVMMFPVWKIAQDKCLSARSSNSAAHKVLLRISVVCATALVAYAVPNFGEFLSLVGSSLCTLLGFVLPCYFHHQVFGNERPMWQRGLDSFLLVGGALFGVVGTITSFMNLLHGEGGAGGN